MIPKIFHVVWIGSEIQGQEKEFLENNKKILSDYECKLWTNDNIEDILGDEHRNYISSCLKNKKNYAHASDCLKLLALKKYGGWALDADVKVFKSFNDLNHHSWVSGFESWAFERVKGSDKEVSINTLDLHPSLKNLSPITAVWGSAVDHKFTNLLLSIYSHPENLNYLITTPNTRWISRIFYENGIVANNNHQYLSNLDVDIFPDYYFCGPYSETGTYSMHYFNGSWGK